MRTTFVAEAEWHGGTSPSSKYNTIDLDRYKERTKSYKIQESKEPRFTHLVVKDDKPSPTSYNRHEAFDSSQYSSIKYSLGKTAKQSFLDIK